MGRSSFHEKEAEGSVLGSCRLWTNNRFVILLNYFHLFAFTNRDLNIANSNTELMMASRIDLFLIDKQFFPNT